ncbi:MAG: hypothetical protein LBP92_08680 [Deltaproteobacteria bacterium]|nr:hypothetical protein [Deltaproteobacteria bacterium]
MGNAPALAIKWRLESTSRDDPVAQGQAGQTHDGGEVIERDSARAVRWFGKTVARSFTLAMMALVNHHATLEALAEVLDAAKVPFERAAELGHVPA